MNWTTIWSQAAAPSFAMGMLQGKKKKIPTMLNWFIVIMGLVPAVLGIISVLIYRKYPVTNEVRGEMKAYFDRQSEE